MSNRVVYSLWPGGECERWEMEPDGFPANYRGTIFLFENGVADLLRVDASAPTRERLWLDRFPPADCSKPKHVSG